MALYKQKIKKYLYSTINILQYSLDSFFYIENNFILNVHYINIVKYKHKNMLMYFYESFELIFFKKYLYIKVKKKLKYILESIFFFTLIRKYKTITLNFIKRFKNLLHIEFKIIGYIYRCFSHLNLIFFKIGYNNLIYILLPLELRFLIVKKNNYRFESLNKYLLKQFYIKIRYFKMPNVYTGRGLIFKGFKIKRKKGKKNYF
jgi:ribosomal protein L6P/L9E